MKKQTLSSSAALVAVTLSSISASAAVLDIDSPENLNFMPADEAAMQDAMNRASILNGRMLDDQAPQSAWSVNPYRTPSGEATCIAGYASNIKNATVTDENGNILSEEDKEALRANTFRIQVTPDGNADIYLGFPTSETSEDVTVYGLPSLMRTAETTNVADIVSTDSYILTAADIFIEAKSERGNDISYQITESLPVDALQDCNEKAQDGFFDEDFNRYSADILAVIKLNGKPEDQESLRQDFAQNGVCPADFEAVGTGEIAYTAFYSPVSRIGIGANNEFGAGDLFQSLAGRFARSQSLSNPLAAPDTSTCMGDTRPVCVETDVTGDTLTARFCEPAYGKLYTPKEQPTPHHSTTTYITNNFAGDSPDTHIDNDLSMTVINDGDDITKIFNPAPLPEDPVPRVPAPPALPLLASALTIGGALRLFRKKGPSPS